MKGSQLIVLLFTAIIATSSCNNKNDTVVIQLSQTSDSILHDTTHYNLIYDSIRNAFFSAESDSLQLYLLIELSGKSKKSTLPLVEDAIKHCIKTSNQFALAEAYCQKGNCFIRFSAFDSASVYLEKARQLALKLNSGKLLSKINFYMGEFYYQQDDNAKAIVEYENSLKIAQGLQDKKLIAYALSGIAESNRMIDENAKSLDYFNRALKITEKIGDKSRTAFCLSSIGEVYRYQGDNKHALVYYEKALKISKSIQDKGLTAFCLSALGSVCVISSDYEKANKYFEQGIVLANETNSKNRLAYCLSSIGEIYRIQNDYAKSLDYFNQTLVISEEIQDKARAAFCFSSIGEIYRTIGNSKSALENLNKAITIAREIDDKSRICFCYNTISEAYLLLGDTAARDGDIQLSNQYYEKGLLTLDSAIKISEEIDDQLRIADCLASKGEIYSRNAKNKSDSYFQKSLDCFKRSIEIAEKIENANRLALSYSCIGSIYLTANDPQTAKLYSEKAIDIAKKSEIPANVLSSSIVLYQAYAKTGDYKKAFEMHQLFKKMSDSLSNVDNIKRFAATEYKAKEDKLKLEKTKQEVVFKAKQEKQEIEFQKQRTVRNAFIVGFALVLILAFVIFRSLQQNRKAKKIIEEQKATTEFQKHIVEEKNKEIIDSITYARRIQNSLLPTEKYIDDQMRRLRKKMN